jgi:outer membrane protein
MNNPFGSRLAAFGSRAALLLVATGTPAAAQEITLTQAVELAQTQGHNAVAVVAIRDAARGRGRAFSARLLPQLSFNATPEFRKSIDPVIQQDGSIVFTPLQQTTANASAGISQRIPFTGGTLFVSSGLQRTELSGARQNLSFVSNPVTLSLQQNLLRPNALRWDSRVQDLQLDVAERAYLEGREGIALQTTDAFFDFYVAKRGLENATKNAATNDTLYTLNKGRFEVGKIGENDLLQSELALLRSRAQLDNAKLDFDRAKAAFRLAINIAPGEPIDVVVSSEIPVVAADTVVAVRQALANRAQITGIELQSVQARRGIAEAKLNNGPGANLQASFGFNQSAPTVDSAYRNLLQQQRFQMALNVPLIQWGARRADVQAAVAEQRRVDALAKVSREQVTQEAHFAALGLAQSRRNLEVNAKADTVAQKRFEVAYNRYVIGRIGIDNLYIAQNEKDQAVTQYLQALRSYWTAYYRLRQVTLFDFAANVAIR